MRSSNFDDVGDFHQKFELHHVRQNSTTHSGIGPQPWDDDLLDFRAKFLQEELDEFNEARATHDQAKMFDALIDLVYVALGTAHLQGYPWSEGWDAVQAANMAKVRAARDGSDSARGSAWDVVKPPGWRPPDVEAVLEAWGFARCPECLTTAVYEVDGPDHTADGVPAQCVNGHQFYAHGLGPVDYVFVVDRAQTGATDGRRVVTASDVREIYRGERVKQHRPGAIQYHAGLPWWRRIFTPKTKS